VTYHERKARIAQLEHIRGSRVLCYVLSDRGTVPGGVPGFVTNLGSESQLWFVDQLRALGKMRQLDLFLYTRGGALDSVWPLVTLLRAYGQKFTVIVPFKAHSGGTLICLGADEIIMTELAQLSPIDPTAGNQFNPQDPNNARARFGISVEDVVAYFSLVTERAGLEKGTHRLEALKELTRNIHPLALGNVQRVYLQIRQLAKNLLELHLDKQQDVERIDTIVQVLTEEFYSHMHAISLREAKPLLGDWVRGPAGEEASIIWELFDSYAETLELRHTFNLPDYMGDELTREVKVTGALIESTECSHIYVTDLKVFQRPTVSQHVPEPSPPSHPVPLVPWVGRTYDYGIQGMGWRINDGGPAEGTRDRR
jgi:hypothetical protein